MLVAAIDTHRALLGRVLRLVAADLFNKHEAAKAEGVKRVCIPIAEQEGRKRYHQGNDPLAWISRLRRGAVRLD
jgi:hypothetical protein